MRVQETIEAKLARWSRDARQLATCSDCYGVGQDMRADDCRACPVCNGSGKAAREPHVVELVDLVRAQQIENQQLCSRSEAETAELRLEVDRLRADLYGLRADIHGLRAERLQERDE